LPSFKSSSTLTSILSSSVSKSISRILLTWSLSSNSLRHKSRIASVSIVTFPLKLNNGFTMVLLFSFLSPGGWGRKAGIKNPHRYSEGKLQGKFLRRCKCVSSIRKVEVAFCGGYNLCSLYRDRYFLKD